MAFYIACDNADCHNNIEGRCVLDTINLRVFNSGGFMKCLNFHLPLQDPPVSIEAEPNHLKYVAGGRKL